MTTTPRKYEFTGEVNAQGLRRIRRLSDGTIGGWVSSENNLSHKGSCFVYGNARMSGNASMSGNARMYDNASMYDNARMSGNASMSGNARMSGNASMSESPRCVTRSDNYTFTLFICTDGIWRLSAGCRFFTMPEAREHWTRTRGGTSLGDETMDILDLFDKHIARQS